LRLQRLVSLLLLLASIAVATSVGLVWSQVAPNAAWASGDQGGSSGAVPATISDGTTRPLPPDITTEDVRKLEAFKVQTAAGYSFSIVVVVSAAVMLALFAAMHALGRASFDFSKHYIVLVVIAAAILLLVMGYTEQQIAPAYGLLGTVLGYIFGRSIGEVDERSTANAAAAAANAGPVAPQVGPAVPAAPVPAGPVTDAATP